MCQRNFSAGASYLGPVVKWQVLLLFRSQSYDRELQRQRCKNLQRC
jgi:hypothetical protein